MSVQMNTYVMYGVVLPYAEAKDLAEQLEVYRDTAYSGIQHTDGICALFDGMSGKYVAIGRVLAKTRNHEGFDAPVDLREHPLMEGTHDLQRQIWDLVGPKILVEEPRLLVISHYR